MNSDSFEDSLNSLIEALEQFTINDFQNELDDEYNKFLNTSDEKTEDIDENIQDLIENPVLLGPNNVWRMQRGDKIIYVFGELHKPYIKNCFKCYNNAPLGVVEFLKNLAEFNRSYLLDFYLESEFFTKTEEKEKIVYTHNKQTRYIENAKRFNEINNLPCDSKDEILDIYNLRNIFSQCAFPHKAYGKVFNIGCAFKNLRVHRIDTRESNSFPSYNSDKEEYKKRLFNYLHSEIHKKISKNIKHTNQVEQKILYTLYVDAVNTYDFLLRGISPREQNDTISMILPYINICKEIAQIHDMEKYNRIKDLPFLDFFIETIKTFNNEDLKYIFWFIHIDIGLMIMDIYTVARMLRSWSNDYKSSPEPQNIIYYGGDAHAQNIVNILSKLGFSSFKFETANSTYLDRNTEYPKCIKLPFNKYSDMFKR